MNIKPVTKNQVIKLLKKIKFNNLKSEKISLINAKGRILSSDITSSINLPPFNNSAVDGYAIRDKDLNNKKKFQCLYRIAAGDNKRIILKPNKVARIFTGALMPKNSSTVIMQENIIKKNDVIYFNKIPKKGENCRLFGEDIKKGKKILLAGDIITSSNINLIAAIGKNQIEVKKKLKIGYFTSGNELKNPKESLNNSEINNSNKFSLFSFLENNTIDSKYLGVLKDSKSKILKSFNLNINKFDVIITAGGASVGEEDHLINILKQKGKVFFWKIAIKPGRPLAVGKIKNTIIICLPGNPVSVHLLYGMIVKPFINYLGGSKFILPSCVNAYANFDMKKKTERMEWLRVNIDRSNDKEIYLNKYPKQGSGIISSIAYSDGVIEIPENVKKIKKGDKFNFYSFKNMF